MRNAVNHFPHGHFGPPLDFLPIFESVVSVMTCVCVDGNAICLQLVCSIFAAIQPQASAEPTCLHTFSTMHSHTHTHTHTLTPMQAVATHYAHTYVFHIFMHLPHGTLSYSLRYPHVRTHTHFQQPITGRQSILNADTEYIARTSKLTDIHSISSNAQMLTPIQAVATHYAHIDTHTSSHR